MREQLAAALIMRADATLTGSLVDFPRLTTLLARMMNQDRHPAVRAWATRAAWNWWVWNPPVRPAINAAFVKLLEQPEPSVLAENARRYQTQALFIANGHRANGSTDHQYPELAQLFEAISHRLDSRNTLLEDRIVALAGTYYSMAGGDGGPGQMGYVTEHSGEMVGKAVMAYWRRAEQAKDLDRVRLSLEAAANATYQPMQKKLLDFAVHGPEKLRTIAATSVSDPRIISLPGTQEFLEPLLEQVNRGAADADRRDQLSKPVFRLFTRARWNIPQTEEQQKIFFRLMMPSLTDEKSDAEWYLAEQFGQLFASNPDLRTDMLLRLLPVKYANALEEYFWLPSVRWLLSHNTPVPEVNGTPARSGFWKPAMDLYLRQLTPQADERLRALALRMVPVSELRNHPEVIAALEKLKPEDAGNYQRFAQELKEAIAQDTGDRTPPMTEAWLRNFTYFRDHVIPEMSRPNRDDEQACFSCHGVAGRVPSMELPAPDRNGYINARNVWKNYRILLDRINEGDVEQSKLLRKPLNVQTGQEDGHQGGRRYAPGDRGYEILKRWVYDAAALRAHETGRQVSP